MAERSAKCLSVVYGEPFVYDALTNAFVSGSDIGKALTLDQKAANRAIAKQKLLDLQAETELRKQQLQAERKQAVVAGTVAACIELYGEDEVAALTNQICNPIFMQIGLPDLAGR